MLKKSSDPPSSSSSINHHHPWLNCLLHFFFPGPTPLSCLTLLSPFPLTCSQPRFPPMLSSRTLFSNMATSLSSFTPISSSHLPPLCPSRTRLFFPALLSPTRASMLISPSPPPTEPTQVLRGATWCLPSVI